MGIELSFWQFILVLTACTIVLVGLAFAMALISGDRPSWEGDAESIRRADRALRQMKAFDTMSKQGAHVLEGVTKELEESTPEEWRK